MTRPTCPKCGSHAFVIEYTATAQVEFFEDDEHEVHDSGCGNVEWDDESGATCLVCGHWAHLNKMIGTK